MEILIQKKNLIERSKLVKKIESTPNIKHTIFGFSGSDCGTFVRFQRILKMKTQQILVLMNFKLILKTKELKFFKLNTTKESGTLNQKI
jgi:hypothetical protein